MTDTAIKATGIAEAAQSFEALLGGESPEPNTPQTKVASEEAPADDDAEAFVGESEGDETAAAYDADAAPEGEAAAYDEDTGDESPEGQLVTVKIDGKTEQIPLEEAIKGYQRQADYSRKTAALAEERKSFDQDRQAVVQERTQYAHLLNALQQQLQAQQPQEPDWQKLYDSDPFEYVRQKDVYRDRQERLAAASYESQRLQGLQAQEQQAQLAALVNDNRQKLVEAVPVWKDAKRWESDRPKILEYGQKLGFTPEELGQTYDHRAVVALWKAMQYDTLVANRPQPVTNKGPKSASAGSASSAPKSTSETARAKQRLAKTGNVRDAATLFESFLD
jgi:hypothetical protein